MTPVDININRSHFLGGNMKKQTKGIILVITGATLWGLGATWSDYLFKEIHIDVNWFTTARLIISGLFLLILHKVFNKNISLFSNFKSKKDIIVGLK
jgi:drug/metabolite transporter (DMT)-like permease